MIKLEQQMVVAFDVDNTLLMWDKRHNKPGKNKLKISNPNDPQEVLYLSPHKVHVRLLRTYKGRGFLVIVWSKNGVDWAEEAVKRLKIEQFVDVVMTKPDKHIDDAIKIEDIIGNRVYLKDRD